MFGIRLKSSFMSPPSWISSPTAFWLGTTMSYPVPPAWSLASSSSFDE